MKKQNEAKNAQPVDVQVGAILKAKRAAAGLSQTDLAEASGITFQQVQKYERGTNRISISRLYEFANTLGLEVHEFFPTGINKAFDKQRSRIEYLEATLEKTRADLKKIIQEAR